MNCKFKLNAVIIKSGRVISTGSNSTNGSFYHGVEKGSKELWQINKCAEKSAILKALKQFDGLRNLAGATIFVTRFNKQGQTRLAKPCKYCQELIESVGIKRVVYTTSTGTETFNTKS